MDDMALEGCFGVDMYTDCSIHCVWGKVEKPDEDNNRDIIHQTRRIFVHWYQLSSPGLAILSDMALEVLLEGIGLPNVCIGFGVKWESRLHVCSEYLLDDLALEVILEGIATPLARSLVFGEWNKGFGTYHILLLISYAQISHLSSTYDFGIQWWNMGWIR